MFNICKYLGCKSNCLHIKYHTVTPLYHPYISWLHCCAVHKGGLCCDITQSIERATWLLYGHKNKPKKFDIFDRQDISNIRLTPSILRRHSCSFRVKNPLRNTKWNCCLSLTITVQISRYTCINYVMLQIYMKYCIKLFCSSCIWMKYSKGNQLLIYLFAMFYHVQGQLHN